MCAYNVIFFAALTYSSTCQMIASPSPFHALASMIAPPPPSPSICGLTEINFQDFTLPGRKS